MSNSIEGRYKTDTCSVSQGKSHGSCNVKCYFQWMRRLCGSVCIVNKSRKKRPLAAYFDENNVQLKQQNHINYLQIFFQQLVSILTKTSENGHHVWGTVILLIYREFNTNMTLLVEIES